MCDAASMRFRIASIDLGTVSSRLLLATVEDGVIVDSNKHTVITNLGEGVDATGSLCDAAIERVTSVCREFCRKVDAFVPDAVCTTLTSAARDAKNGAVLIDALRGLGLCPQVIPGEVEAKLTFYGVAHDFEGQVIAVADSGGGSTELALGSYGAGRPLELSSVESLNIGCRRVTERFFSALPPQYGEVERAASWAAEQFGAFWAGAAERPDRLIAVGGTVTTLVAMVERMEHYDSSRVHLHRLGIQDVEACIEAMRVLDAASVANLPGVQEKRASVLLGGAVIIRELMKTGGYDELTVSENNLLAGMAATMFEALAHEGDDGFKPVVGWKPELS